MSDSLDEHAKAIGLLCMEWSYLEGDVKNCFLKLSGWPDRFGTRAMINCLDVRHMLSALKVGAYAMRYNQDCCAKLAATVDYIDNYLRPARNRCVHDQWSPALDREGAIRYASNPVIRRARPHSELRWVDDGVAALVTSEEIHNLVADVKTQRDYLKLIVGWAVSYPPEQQFPANVAELPLRPLLPRHEEKPSQKGKGRAIHQPQPSPSQE